MKEGDKSVKCTLCNTILTYHGGISSMRSHLSGKHDRMITVNHDSTTSSDSSCSSHNHHYVITLQQFNKVHPKEYSNIWLIWYQLFR